MTLKLTVSFVVARIIYSLIVVPMNILPDQNVNYFNNDSSEYFFFLRLQILSVSNSLGNFECL